MNSNDLVVRLKEERDRHVIGYPGPRRDVAELLDNALDRFEALEAWKAEAMEVLREIATAGRAIGSDDAVVRFYTETGYREINYAVFSAARRLVEQEDGRG